MQAKEFGEAEVWMNERLMRAAPGCFAEFITAFEAEEKSSKNKGPEPLWLIWQYEGDYTLWDLMQKKDFPYNLEQALLGRELDMPKGPQRKAVTISLVMQQVGLLLSFPCAMRCFWLAQGFAWQWYLQAPVVIAKRTFFHQTGLPSLLLNSQVPTPFHLLCEASHFQQLSSISGPGS